jgi:hypothetical protein
MGNVDCRKSHSFSAERNPNLGEGWNGLRKRACFKLEGQVAQTSLLLPLQAPSVVLPSLAASLLNPWPIGNAAQLFGKKPIKKSAEGPDGRGPTGGNDLLPGAEAPRRLNSAKNYSFRSVIEKLLLLPNLSATSTLRDRRAALSRFVRQRGILPG